MEHIDCTDPAHNLNCQRRFTCAAARCPDAYAILKDADCHIDRFGRYQPETTWYRRDWGDVSKISWHEVFGLKEVWLYSLYIIIIAVFIFMAMMLVKVLIIFRYY